MVIGLSSLGASTVFTMFLPYCQHVMHLTVNNGYKLFAVWLSLFFLLPVVSGYFGQKYIGYRKAVLIGLVLSFLGELSLALGHLQSFRLALVMFSIGASLYTTNLYSLFSKLFSTQSAERTRAFVIFYVAMNAGAFLGDFLSGFLIKTFSYSSAFIILSVSILISAIIFATLAKQLSEPNITTKTSRKAQWLYYTAVPIISVILIYHTDSLDTLSALVLVFCVIYLVIKNRGNPRSYKVKARYFLFFSAFMILYWGLYMLYPSVVEVFTGKDVITKVFGETLQPSTIASLSPLFLIIFGVMLSLIKRNVDTIKAIHVKIALSLLIMGIGFYVLCFGHKIMGDSSVLGYVTLGYLCHALSEIFIGPVVFSMVGLLIPESMIGIMMGFSYLTRSASGALTGILSRSFNGQNVHVVFSSYATISLIAAVILFTTLYAFEKRKNK